jgi:hypothetical protein
MYLSPAVEQTLRDFYKLNYPRRMGKALRAHLVFLMMGTQSFAHPTRSGNFFSGNHFSNVEVSDKRRRSHLPIETTFLHKTA